MPLNRKVSIQFHKGFQIKAYHKPASFSLKNPNLVIGINHIPVSDTDLGTNKSPETGIFCIAAVTLRNILLI